MLLKKIVLKKADMYLQQFSSMKLQSYGVAKVDSGTSFTSYQL